MIVAISIFGVSSIGLLLLLVIKTWENSRGRIFFAPLRVPLRRRSARFLAYVRGDAPRSLGRTLRIARRVARAYISYVYAKVLYFFERLLEQGLHKVREVPGADQRGEASPFLREVAAYKKMLEREKKEGDASVEK